MRRLILVAALVAAAGAAAPAQAEPRRFVLDPEHLVIDFSVMHIGYARVRGQFLAAQGSFVFDEATRALSDLVVTVDPGSVFTNHQERDGHIRGRDFLAADSHPEIRFVMTRAVAQTETTGQIEGDLTIRGVTRPATLEVTLNKIGPYPFGSNYVVGVSARGTIQRSAFGMTYALDNGWVGDDIEITIEAEAIRQ